MTPAHPEEDEPTVVAHARPQDDGGTRGRLRRRQSDFKRRSVLAKQLDGSWEARKRTRTCASVREADPGVDETIFTLEDTAHS